MDNTEHVLFSASRSPITNCPRWGFNVVLTACRYMEASETDTKREGKHDNNNREKNNSAKEVKRREREREKEYKIK